MTNTVPINPATNLIPAPRSAIGADILDRVTAATGVTVERAAWLLSGTTPARAAGLAELVLSAYQPAAPVDEHDRTTARLSCPTWCADHSDDAGKRYHFGDRVTVGGFEAQLCQDTRVVDGPTDEPPVVFFAGGELSIDECRRLAASLTALVDQATVSTPRDGAAPGWAVDVYDDTAPGGFATRTFCGPKVTVPTAGPMLDDPAVWVQAERSVPLPGHEDDPGLGGIGDRVFVATEWSGTAAELTPAQARAFALTVLAAADVLTGGVR